MAWNAVTSMDPAEVEVLDLATRHDVDLGLVLGLPGQEARALLDRARQDLVRALSAELLVSRGSHACPDRVRVMRGWAGTVTPELRDRVLRHAATCPVCGPNLPRNVSAPRVFALLPEPAPPADARQRVLTFASDPQMAAYREFAVSRAADPATASAAILAALEAPAATQPPATQPPATKPSVAKSPVARAPAPRPRRHTPAHTSPVTAAHAGIPRGRILTALAVTATAAVVAAALVLAGVGGAPRNPSREPAAQAAGPAGSRHAEAGAEGAAPIAPPTTVPQPSPSLAASPGEQLFVKLTQPLPSDRASAPHGQPPSQGAPGPFPEPSATLAAPSAQGSLDVSPDSLQLGTASAADVTITAQGATESWSASTSSSRLDLSTDGGTLSAGQSVTLTVTVDRAGASGGNAVLYVDEGSSAQAVRVSWAPQWSGGGRPSPSRSSSPTAPASPAPSASPVPSASPSPSNSSGSSPPSRSPSPAPTQGPTRQPRPGPQPQPTSPVPSR